MKTTTGDEKGNLLGDTVGRCAGVQLHEETEQRDD
jgi:hypothetical protein